VDVISCSECLIGSYAGFTSWRRPTKASSGSNGLAIVEYPVGKTLRFLSADAWLNSMSSLDLI